MERREASPESVPKLNECRGCGRETINQDSICFLCEPEYDQTRPIGPEDDYPEEDEEDEDF
jgi:hypothetical protein